MRKVLFIAYLFPPFVNSGTRRSLSFSVHLPRHGWEPLVLTLADVPAQVCDVSLLAELRPDTVIERAPLGSAVMGERIARVFAPSSFRARVTAGLEWRLRGLTGVPDEAGSWYAQAVKRGVQIHRERGFEVIYASGWPWTAFLVARGIALRTGCPYVLDYRDLWKSTGTTAWEREGWLPRLLNPWLERRVAREAAEIVTVTQSLAEKLRKDTGVKRVHCITNGYEPDDFGAARAAMIARPRDGLLRVVYTGVWRPGYGPDGLYRAVRRLKDAGSPAVRRLQVCTAGYAPGPAREHGIEDIVLELGPVSHEKALTMMGGADLLYLPVSEGFYANASLPGKLFEYLGSERPILAAVPAGSEVARVLNDVGGAMLLEPGDETAIAETLDALIAGRGRDAFSTRRPERLAQYTRAETTGMLARVFDAACVRARSDAPT